MSLPQTEPRTGISVWKEQFAAFARFISAPNARIVYLYLIAIVLANLTVAWFGPNITIVNAFLFIGLDLTSRDKLHDAWKGRGLLWKMGVLIVAGSAISYLLNQDAARIALASCVSFGVSAIVDGIAYQILHRRMYLVRVNGSNLFSAMMDSILFPTIAFGSFLPWITLGQFAAKIVGGFVWSLVLKKVER